MQKGRPGAMPPSGNRPRVIVKVNTPCTAKATAAQKGL